MKKAYEATLKGMSVYRAAREFNIPESTLRDRTRGNVAVEAKCGVGTLFSEEEEWKLVKHIRHTAEAGQVYNKSSVRKLATRYATSLHKVTRSAKHLSSAWLDGFMQRWPEITFVKQSTGISALDTKRD